MVPCEDKLPLSDFTVETLTKIIELCRENNVELILYTAPYKADSDEQRIFNALSDFAADKGIEYHNMMHEMDEISLNVHSDFLDEGHLNRTGQEKFTRYMAEHGYFG